MLCADAPAKAFVLNVKSHSGYSSCTKCIEKGEYQNRRIAFSDKPSRLRTDEDFINKTSEGYHLGTSCLENIPQFGLVSHVPLDYQHLLCLGVVKKLINLWLCDALKVRLPFRKVQVISNALENIIRPHVPVEFQRKPRSLFHFRQWKATEWRQLLLYTGPTILKPVLSTEVFNNFLTLHVAITILCSNSCCLNEKYLEYAQNLLQHFVTTFKIIYGSHHVSHNVHGLLHLTYDVRNYGSLDMFSLNLRIICSRSKNFLGNLKNHCNKLLKEFKNMNVTEKLWMALMKKTVRIMINIFLKISIIMDQL